jgi:tetratricopeptide (TPR) repeat protein
MAKLARLPEIDRALQRDRDDFERIPRLRTRYYAFLSYSHKDKDLADWLHRELERFRVPGSLAGRLTANGVVPKRLSPIFRDQHDLSAGGDLAEEIKAALAASQFLVVLCSPTAAKSSWTNQEIESFKRTRPEGCVLAAVVAGEPFASDIPGREEEECFPPALRYKYDRRGRPTNKRADPLAADFRAVGEGKRLAFLKLVAGMLGIGLDELVQRETTRRHRQLAWLAAASLGGMAVTSTLAVTAFEARNEAREQRREAEGLVSFMLGDLKDKLEPIGRLDALDGVGARVLAYYQKQDKSGLSDAALSQRSKALALMGQVADSRGKLDDALRLYREAMDGTAEAIRRNPRDPEAIWEHAQNAFYIGSIAQERDDYRTAENAMRDYKRLALRMVSLAPDSMKYRMEEQYAEANLGIVLKDQRRFAEAAGQFRDALRTMDAIATADPKNREYRKGLAEATAWLADTDVALGNYREALALRQRDIALLESLLRESNDVDYRQRLIPAHRALGNVYADLGQTDAAIQQFRLATAHSDALARVEPDNAQWTEYGAWPHFDLAKQLLQNGQKDEAAAQVQAGCQMDAKLLSRDGSKAAARKLLTSCLMLQAQLARATGAQGQARGFAEKAVAAAASVHTSDPFEDATGVARAYRLLGDVERENGDAAAASSAWNSALARLSSTSAEEPDQLALHAAILERLGRLAEAQPLRSRLTNMGYRQQLK